MAVKLTDIETGATKVRDGLHAFGTAHPFTLAFAVLAIAEIAAHFGVHF